MDTSGYFNAAANMLRVGDFILTNASAGGSVENGVLVVLSNTGTTVDVGNLQTFVSGNTD